MNKYKKLFIATSSFSEISKEKKKFKKKIVVKLNFKKKLDKVSLIKYAFDADYIIAGTEIYNKEIISKLSNLKYIFRLGSGTDNVDIKFLEKRKLVLKNQKLHLKFQ